jgi:hypothetical protein
MAAHCVQLDSRAKRVRGLSGFATADLKLFRREKTMKNNAQGRTGRGAISLAAGAISAVIMATGSTASASGDRSYAISGNSIFSDCGLAGSDFALLMTGDLEGCLSIFVQGYTCKERNGFDHYTERGREVYVGAWRGKHGRFVTDYTVNAAYASGFCQTFDFTLQLSGSCTHRIDGRSGVFADAEGVFTLFDVVTGVTGDPVTGAFTPGSGANNFVYTGRIRTGGTQSLRPAASEGAASVEARSSQSGEVAARKAQSRRSC